MHIFLTLISFKILAFIINMIMYNYFSFLDNFEQAKTEGVHDDDIAVTAKTLHQSRDDLVLDAKHLAVQITGRELPAQV